MSSFRAVAPSPEELAMQIEKIGQDYPGALIVGSLGRAAAYQELCGDPTHEYTRRSQVPTENSYGDTADIDLIGAPSSASTREDLGPFVVDTRAFNNNLVAISNEDGNWIIRSKGTGVEKTLDPEALKPMELKTIYGIECKVPPPQTQLAIMSATGAVRPQDAVAIETLSKVIKEAGIRDLADEVLSPFYEIGAINRATPAVKMGRIYRRALPEIIRLRLSPLVGPIKDYIELHFA